MTARSEDADLAAWQAHRPQLLGLAYRMLGDFGRAEDLVQEAWVRWSGRQDDARDAGAYLVALVTRLCLTELDSARARREESRGDRLPEPVDLKAGGLAQLESIERVSMAFLVVLQRLTPAERAVLLLHEVFDFDHSEIAALVGKTVPACRKLLERARASVESEKRLLAATREEHARLLDAFVRAASSGDVGAIAAVLAEDAVLVTDGGAEGRRFEGGGNLTKPLEGAQAVAEFVAKTAARGLKVLTAELRELNGQPALVLSRDGRPFAAMLLGIAGGRVHRVYFHSDAARLGHLGARA